ncbi:M15 family metallopeptidase [Blastococcus aurantiacus]|uniref:M15 family metallopeptidase n=1 Tax=Blastococcus aurantiacus TaxID=1550231 RepID=UPI001C40B917|nr:M15 family metallopeptidase [Blastococcus aurantiacus]
MALAAGVGAVVGSQAVDASSATVVRPLPELGAAVPLVPDGVTVDDGVVPGGGTTVGSGLPAVTELDPALLTALRRAAGAAADDGVAFTVTSGWRSAEYQEQLLREAVAEHGSAEEAARWVATSDTSAHVSGDAVDLGPASARSWLAEHGAAYGLCQIYRNEPWHYELRAGAADRGCPGMYADPTHDPRMQP